MQGISAQILEQGAQSIDRRLGFLPSGVPNHSEWRWSPRCTVEVNAAGMSAVDTPRGRVTNDRSVRTACAAANEVIIQTWPLVSNHTPPSARSDASVASAVAPRPFVMIDIGRSLGSIEWIGAVAELLRSERVTACERIKILASRQRTPTAIQALLYQLRTDDHRRTKLARVWSTLFVPSNDDRVVMHHLPRVLGPLCYVIHPVRIVVRWLRRGGGQVWSPRPVTSPTSPPHHR